MKITQVVLPGIVEPESLQVVTRQLPDPGVGEARVRVEATGVSFAEQQMRRGKYFDQPPFPFVPGYDLVGTVEAVGRDTEDTLIGARVAALTKTGAWADHAVLDTRRLVRVPDGIDPAEAESVVVNGVTAWRLLHQCARTQPGQTAVVLGAAGGVGSTLVQLARLAGVAVIGVASSAQIDAVRALGATPLDYRQDNVKAKVLELVPEGVAAVFDHVGGDGLFDSWAMLRTDGILVSYGTAATLDVSGDPARPVMELIERLATMNADPSPRRARFFNLWEGVEDAVAFDMRLRDDLTEVFTLLAAGALQAHVAARCPLREAGAALRLAETRGLVGKVVLVPDRWMF
ncbi:MAG: medium chain dehydrogenase/reductase family protein [Acidimicrobiales bacterium]